MSAWIRVSLVGSTDRVTFIAPVAHDVGVRLKVRYLRFISREEAFHVRSTSPVVGLVCVVSSIAEDDDSSN